MISTDEQNKVVGAISVYNDLAHQYNQLKLDYVMPIKRIDEKMSVAVVYARLSILCLKMLEHLERMQEKQDKESSSFVDDGFFEGL